MAQLGPLSAEMETLSYVLRLMDTFKAFDSDNDGSITCVELGGLMGSLGYKLSEQEVHDMMREGDKNKDGRLSIVEFLEMNTKDLEMGKMASNLKCALEAMDDDVVVTAEELCGVMGDMGVRLSMGDCQEIIASIDVDGDGAVNSEDLKLILNSLF